ncbi:cell division cycle 25 homolog d isoform X2 [Sardina pilchardus]|uniref:cell division cycle 25 homolog d isoform X2 n=1 Tax=Sardina pilchardus TaxID=27697 RepID=UPI002E0ED38F
MDVSPLNTWNDGMSPQSLSPAGNSSSPVSDLTLLFYSLHCQDTNIPWRDLQQTPDSHSPPGALYKRQLGTPTVRNSTEDIESRERFSPEYSAPKRRSVRVKLSSRFPKTVNQEVISLAKEQYNTSPAEGTLSQEEAGTVAPVDDMALLSLGRVRSKHHPSRNQILESLIGNHLIGDFSKMHVLPIEEVDQDLHCVSANTVASLLNGEFESTVEDFLIIDCRYPYEYLGGHIKGAVNLHTEAQVQKAFHHGLTLGQFSRSPEEQNSSSPETGPGALSPLQSKSQRKLLIFHCELSSKRGPRLCKYLRKLDRNLHSCVYPHLYHPEVYLLHGGYKQFFTCFPDLCDPKGYVPMRHRDFREQLKGFRQKKKTARRRQNFTTTPKTNN